MNLIVGLKGNIRKILGTGIYVHWELRNWNIDNNNDSFLDNPFAAEQ